MASRRPTRSWTRPITPSTRPSARGATVSGCSRPTRRKRARRLSPPARPHSLFGVIDDREDEDAVGAVVRYTAQRIRPVSRAFGGALLHHARGSLEEALDLVDPLAGQMAVYRYSRERGVLRMLAQIELTGDPRRRFVPSRHPLSVPDLSGAGRVGHVEIPTSLGAGGAGRPRLLRLRLRRRHRRERRR